ncbi:MAG: mRNA surveillance protein pelota [Candidatus Thermoplasmatota archaeon]|nr:mRNA surveillance protein pelota [Candidatus Thermoplasmatota archaeon]
MRVMKDQTSDGSIKLRVENMDDLWYLHQLLDRSSQVGAYTFRKLESRDDVIRSDSQPRVRVYLRISVEDTEFQPFTDALRIKGTILEGPPDISGHHTINANIGTVMDLWKDPMTEIDKQVLDEACNTSGYLGVLAISMDDETAEVYRVRDYGVERIAEVKVGQGGKMYGSGDRWLGYYDEIMKVIDHHLGDGAQLIVSGPGFFKDKLAKLLKETGRVESERIHLLQSSSGGISGLKESFFTGQKMASAVSDLRFVRENNLMGELMARIGKGSGATYGMEEVRSALKIGAVETLLITEDLFREGPGKELMRSAGTMGSSSMVISTAHEMGQMLDKLGGAGALLRFEV